MLSLKLHLTDILLKVLISLKKIYYFVDMMYVHECACHRMHVEIRGQPWSHLSLSHLYMGSRDWSQTARLAQPGFILTHWAVSLVLLFCWNSFTALALVYWPCRVNFLELCSWLIRQPMGLWCILPLSTFWKNLTTSNFYLFFEWVCVHACYM